MPLNLSNDQLETLITRLVGAQQAGAAGGQALAVGREREAADAPRRDLLQPRDQPHRAAIPDADRGVAP